MQTRVYSSKIHRVHFRIFMNQIIDTASANQKCTQRKQSKTAKKKKKDSLMCTTCIVSLCYCAFKYSSEPVSGKKNILFRIHSLRRSLYM